ncbi:hypothetical protein BD560DRAFT_445170 [Blakeslea trispora]|nr:hypothetical protein BD560DRAFT_445170 [Blakeslea trispora]
MPQTEHNELLIRGVNTPSEDFRKCVFVIDELLSCFDCHQFLIPVPKTAFVYHHEIKQPMDFKTLEQNLYDGKYNTYEEFVCDLELIWNNARQFHRSFDPIYQQAENLCGRFRAISTYLNGGAQPYYLSVAINNIEAVSNQQLPEEIVSHDGKSLSSLSPPPLPFPMYKEIDLPKKSNLYFIQALSEQDCATKKLRGFSNVRVLFQCLNASFFNGIDTADRTQMPLPRFYIAKNRTLLNQAKTDPNGALAILFNVHLTPLKADASQKNLYQMQSTVVLCEPVGDTHNFDDSTMDKSTKHEFFPKAWLKLKVQHVVHNAIATVDSDLDRNYLKKPYNTFRLSTKTPLDPKKVSNNELAKQFVRSILEPAPSKQSTLNNSIDNNSSYNRSSGFLKEQPITSFSPTITKSSIPSKPILPSQTKEHGKQPHVEQVTNTNMKKHSEQTATAMSPNMKAKVSVDQRQISRSSYSNTTKLSSETHKTPFEASKSSPSPAVIEKPSPKNNQPKTPSKSPDSLIDRTDQSESPRSITSPKTLTSIRLVVKQPEPKAGKSKSRPDASSSLSPMQHQSNLQLPPSTRRIDISFDKNSIPNYTPEEDSDSTASYEYSEEEREEVEMEGREEGKQEVMSHGSLEDSSFTDTANKEDSKDQMSNKDTNPHVKRTKGNTNNAASSQPPVVYERYLQSSSTQEKGASDKPQLPEKEKQYYLEASKQLWIKITQYAHQKKVPVINLDQYNVCASSTTPNAEGFFKNVFFDPHDRRKVIQTFKRMTITQRTTEIAGLLALKGLPHMGQITHVLKEDHGEIIGLCMERYQKTLKQYTHAHSHHRLTAYQKMDLVIQMLESIATIHRIGLAHRDLSEVNFMVNQTELKLRDGSPKAALYLIDFGKSTFVSPDVYRCWWVEQPRLELEGYGDEIIPRTKEELDAWCQRLPWIPSRPDHGYKLYRSIQTLPKSRNDTEGLAWLVNPILEDLYSIGTLIWKTFAETEPWYGIMDNDIKALRDIVSDDYRLQKALEREVRGHLSRELLLKFLKVSPQQRESAESVLLWLSDETIQNGLIGEWEINAPVARQKRHAKLVPEHDDKQASDINYFQRKRHKTGYTEADT